MITTTLGLACVSKVFLKTIQHMGSENGQSYTHKRKATATAIKTAFALVWPLALSGMIPCGERENRAVMFPLLWSFGMWSLDLTIMHTALSSQEGKPATIRFDPSPLSGLAFGFCHLVGSRPESQYAHLFMYAILGCLLFVLPSHNLEHGCVWEQVVENVQKAILQWCIGLLIAAIMLTHFKSSQCSSSYTDSETKTEKAKPV